jgi:hypothetical protein
LSTNSWFGHNFYPAWHGYMFNWRLLFKVALKAYVVTSNVELQFGVDTWSI